MTDCWTEGETAGTDVSDQRNEVLGVQDLIAGGSVSPFGREDEEVRSRALVTPGAYGKCARQNGSWSCRDRGVWDVVWVAGFGSGQGCSLRSLAWR